MYIFEYTTQFEIHLCVNEYIFALIIFQCMKNVHNQIPFNITQKFSIQQNTIQYNQMHINTIQYNQTQFNTTKYVSIQLNINKTKLQLIGYTELLYFSKTSPLLPIFQGLLDVGGP